MTMRRQTSPISPTDSGIYRSSPISYASAVTRLSENLKRLRGDDTQEGVAARVGVKQPVYSKWETGKAVPKIKHLLRIAVAHGVTVGKLLHGLDADYDSLDSDPTRHTGRDTTHAQSRNGTRKAGTTDVVGLDETRRLQAENATLRTKLGQLRDFIDELTDVGGHPVGTTHRVSSSAPTKDRRRHRGSR